MTGQSGERDPLVVAAASGHLFGGYRIIQRIGEGGMGVVYLALDGEHRAVALKVLRPHVAGDPDARVRLAREVATLQRVQDDRIARVLDADVDSDQPFLVTEYVAGPTLDAVIRERGALGASALLKLGFGLGDALGAIHRAGVVHRDLKPSNVLLQDGAPVVIDFGIAHIADDVRLTMTGLVMGTPGYLSPELIEGGTVERATDWWGWAATMVFAATGRPPFGKGPMEVVLDRVRRGEADLAGVPAALVDVLTAALSPVTSERPRPAELRKALVDLQSHDDDSPDLLDLEATARDVDLRVPAVTEVIAQGSTEVLSSGATEVIAQASTEVLPSGATEVIGARPVIPATVLHPSTATPTLVHRGVASTRALPLSEHAPPAPHSRHAEPIPVREPVFAPLPLAAPLGGSSHQQPVFRQPPPDQRTLPAQQPGFRQPTFHQPNPQPPPQQPHGVAALWPPRRGQAPQQPPHGPAAPAPLAQPMARQPAPRSGRHGTILLGWLTLAAATVVAPIVMVAGFSVFAALSRAIDRVSTGLLLRRRDRGKRASDLAYALFSSPLHVIAGLLWQIICLFVPLFLGICAYFATGLALPTTGTTYAEAIRLAAAGGVFGFVSWWGPGGASLQRGTRSLVRTISPGRLGGMVAVLLLLAALAGLGYLCLQNNWHSDWWPLAGQPLDQWIGEGQPLP